jgi:long-chain acyl-CoA synthetase
MTICTINEMFYRAVERNLERALLFKRKIEWVPVSSRELYRDVVGVAQALERWGVGKGDRVAILSENRPEWAIADFATMLLGAATVPIYSTLTPEQTLYLLRDSGARVIFVSTSDQLRKLMSIKGECVVEKIVMMDFNGTPEVVPMQSLMESGPSSRDPEFDRRALSVGPDELATLIYTSGTTGVPKGAMLTQNNLASNLLHSLDLYAFRPGQISISFLPLSHITARHADYAMMWHGITVAYCPYIDELLASLLEVKPHFFVAVPRVYEKLHNHVLSKIGPKGLKRRMYNWAIGVGRTHKDEVLAGEMPTSIRWRLANRLLFSKIKAALGGRMEIFISGGAPLSRDLIDWYGCIGIRIYEGYGLTETSPVIALNNPNCARPGSVGPVLKNVQVRIAPDGEILVKGPSVFKGYWNMPEETAKAFEDGWFHTGDVGEVDEEGFLFVTDRKKDLIKTSGGKFIAPQPIEGRLKANALVGEAAIIGDRRKFPSVVLAPNFPELEEWAKQRKLQWNSRDDLIAHPQVCALYQEIVEDINKDLARYEKLKKLLLVADEFSIANGALTPTMKLKRRFIEERYRGKLDELYAEEAPGVGLQGERERLAG